jgi:chaperonin GroEL
VVGSSLVKAKICLDPKNSIGEKIVFEACSKPFSQILKNAGVDDSTSIQWEMNVYNCGRWDGYNIKTEKVVNMKKEGIIDPTKVTRIALENAASVAGTVLLTECVIVEDLEDKKEDTSSMMNGMF